MIHRTPYAGPLYEQVSRRLKIYIRERGWQAGQALPSEVTLAQRFGVSLGTMRSALQRLEDRGWLERKQGSGTRVTNVNDYYVRRFCRYQIEIDGAPAFPEYSADEISREVRKATADERRRLMLKEPRDDLLVVERYLTCKIGPIIRETVRLPLERFPGIDKSGPLPIAIFTMLDTVFDVETDRVHENIRPHIGCNVLEVAGVKNHEPLLECNATAFDTQGTPHCLITQLVSLRSAECAIVR
ncbi:MAG: GntR family transcriptional regulator [Hyphomicrobiaceae bacterium]|nr:GntR family transcriptional regulator [Hyphomicrobiaceae bacterium]